jgi:mannose-6-phosphate isomerase-like protein (cupin superfamily)
MIVPKVWGSEKVIVNTPGYCGKFLRVAAGMQCSLHRHRIKDETFYVVSGVLNVELGPTPDEARNNPIVMHKDDSIRVAPGSWHRFGSVDGAVIAEFSTHHDDADVERAEESGPLMYGQGGA